jgi:DNA-binding GntR family transcriptional regulator
METSLSEGFKQILLDTMNIRDRIYKQIRNDIIYGKLMPGERLPEIKLSKALGCSRAPLREAFNQLEKEGFVYSKQNQGVVVNKSSPEEIIDYYSLLEVLESQAVEWAADRLTSGDLARLSELNDSMKKVSANDKKYIEKWVSLNLAFHGFFSEKCGNEKMIWLVQEIRLRITRFRYLSFMVTTFNDYIRDHETIIEALRQRDADKARAAMKNHISRAKKVLLKHFFYMPEA